MVNHPTHDNNRLDLEYLTSWWLYGGHMNINSALQLKDFGQLYPECILNFVSMRPPRSKTITSPDDRVKFNDPSE